MRLLGHRYKCSTYTLRSPPVVDALVAAPVLRHGVQVTVQRRDRAFGGTGDVLWPSQGTATTVPDIDLRSAVYLAGRLLASLYGSPVGEVAP